MADTYAKSTIGIGVYIMVDGAKKELMEVKSLPEFAATPSKLEATHLKNTTAVYEDGVADMGSDLQIVCNAIPSGISGSNIDLINSLNPKTSYQVIIEYPAIKWMVSFFAQIRGNVAATSVNSIIDYNVTLTPKSDPVRVPMTGTYKITYSGNAPGGGSVSGTTTDASTYTAGQDAIVKECAFTVTGYKFGGWSESANGEGKSYRAGDTIVMVSNLTLYAQWIKEAA